MFDGSDSWIVSCSVDLAGVEMSLFVDEIPIAKAIMMHKYIYEGVMEWLVGLWASLCVGSMRMLTTELGTACHTLLLAVLALPGSR